MTKKKKSILKLKEKDEVDLELGNQKLFNSLEDESSNMAYFLLANENINPDNFKRFELQ